MAALAQTAQGPARHQSGPLGLTKQGLLTGGIQSVGRVGLQDCTTMAFAARQGRKAKWLARAHQLDREILPRGNDFQQAIDIGVAARVQARIGRVLGK